MDRLHSAGRFQVDQPPGTLDLVGVATPFEPLKSWNTARNFRK